MIQEKRYSIAIDDIQDALYDSPDSFVKQIYIKVVGKEPQSRKNIEIIIECLSEVDEEFFSTIYSEVLRKKCKFDFPRQVYIIEDH